MSHKHISRVNQIDQYCPCTLYLFKYVLLLGDKFDLSAPYKLTSSEEESLDDIS